MPVQIYWVDEPAIMANDYMGVITKEDSDNAFNKTFEAVARGPLYLLVDLRQVTTMPNVNTRILINLINHPNTRWLAIVGANAFAKFLIQAIVRHKAKAFDDREKAEVFLRERLAAEKNIARPA